MIPALPPAAASADTSSEDWDCLKWELNRLGRLENDWDGQGAAALNVANLNAAHRWLDNMRRWDGAIAPVRVVPGTTGEVVLEWRGESFYLAAEISDPSCIEWLLDLPGQPLRQWITDAERPWIVRSER